MRLGPDGASQRATWELAAKRGSVVAQAKLREPSFPEVLSYLWTWTLELFGRSGISSAGVSALSYETIAYWSVLTGQHPSPREVRALMELDGALRGSAPPEKGEEVLIPWPERRDV